MRGQVTLFIIVGVVLVLGASALFYMQGQYVEDEGRRSLTNANIPVDYQPVWEYVANCADKAFLRTATEVGQRGGHFVVRDGITVNDISIPYYFKNGFTEVPDIGGIYDSLRIPLEERMLSCVNNFSDLDVRGMEIEETGAPEITLEPTRNHTMLTLNYPLRLYKGEKEYTMEEYQIEYDTRFPLFLAIVDEIMQTRQDDPYFIHYDLLNNISETVEGLEVKFHSVSDSTTIYMIKDNRTLTAMNDPPYNFYFATHVEDDAYKPYLVNDTIVMQEDHKFEGFIDAESWHKTRVRMAAESMLYINQNGFVGYTPTADELGNHTINVSLYDGHARTTDQLTVQVVPYNNAPVVEVSDVQAYVGQMFNYTVQAYDEETEGFLDYELVDGPERLTMAGKYLFWNPPLQQGEHEVTVRVSDGVKSTKANFTIDVVEYDGETNVTLVGPDTVQGEVNSLVRENFNGIDPDGDELNFSDDAEEFDIEPDTGLVEFVPEDAGTFAAEISVEDENNATDSKVVQFEISSS